MCLDQSVCVAAAPDWSLGASLSLPVSGAGCAIEEIAASASGRFAVTQRFSGQGECGFDVIDLDRMEWLGGVPERAGYILELPVFSDDESRVVAAIGPRLGGWWAHPDDDVDEPSRGGVVDLATLYELRLESRELHACRLELDVPEGWLPEDPWSEAWLGPTRLEAVDGGLRMVLPGGDPFRQIGPLPDVLRLPPLAAFT
ncbi:MAG: hypothetical protein KC619_25005 [Myxococcales bacterium]|nr:hypothetical protein [Myxococcales bacterium]